VKKLENLARGGTGQGLPVLIAQVLQKQTGGQRAPREILGGDERRPRRDVHLKGAWGEGPLYDWKETKATALPRRQSKGQRSKFEKIIPSTCEFEKRKGKYREEGALNIKRKGGPR